MSSSSVSLTRAGLYGLWFLGACTAAPPGGDRAAPEAESIEPAAAEYRSECQGLVGDLIDRGGDRDLARSGDRSLARAVEQLGAAIDAPVAALDLITCRRGVCLGECAAGEDEACLSCLDRRCSTAASACRGTRWAEYESDTSRPLRRCWQIRRCQSECELQRCRDRCYFDGRPRARSASWRFWALENGRCRDRCERLGIEECALCLRSYRVDRGLDSCFEPPATDPPPGRS